MSKTKALKKTERKYKGRGDFKKPKPIKPLPKKGTRRSRKIDKIIAVRGVYCFYCGEPMRKQDMTIEHLKAKFIGGTNSIHNLYLAHEWCNKEAGHKYTKNKKKMREIRTEEAWHRCFVENN